MTHQNILGIIDSGIGNIRSIERMVTRVGGSSILIHSVSELHTVNKVILPGVGHFDYGITQLNKLGLDTALSDLIKSKQLTVLGICLGMQLLCNRSEEGDLPGLGLIDAEVRRIIPQNQFRLKVPHMGWNIVKSSRQNILLPISQERQRFYFVHSFKVIPRDPDLIIGTTDYGGEFCSAFQQGNIYGVQFHPEKSHRYGMALVQRFVEL